MEKYIGLDVHSTSCTAVVVDARVKRLSTNVIETNGQALINFIKTQAGRIQLCMEEGTQSGWLAEILSPHVFKLAVVGISASRGPKNDALDAFGLAEKMRTNALGVTVYKRVGAFGKLRPLVKTHAMVVQDVVRVKSRLKALFRSRGVRLVGKEIYQPSKRDAYLEELPAGTRDAALILFSQYDLLSEVKDRAESEMVQESHRHPITKILETAPGLGPIRVAQLVSIVVTPERFRTRQQFWSYCGFGLVMRSSADWVQTPQGKWTRANVQQTRGLNFNHNHMLKNVFKGAATTVITQKTEHALRRDYNRLLDGGTKPNLAKLTIARKLAALTLAMWKKKEVYDSAKSSPPPKS